MKTVNSEFSEFAQNLLNSLKGEMHWERPDFIFLMNLHQCVTYRSYCKAPPTVINLLRAWGEVITFMRARSRPLPPEVVDLDVFLHKGTRRPELPKRYAG